MKTFITKKIFTAILFFALLGGSGSVSAAEPVCSRDDILVCDDFEDRNIGRTLGYGMADRHYDLWYGGIVDSPVLPWSARTWNQHYRRVFRVTEWNRDTLYTDAGVGFAEGEGEHYARWYGRWADGFQWNSNVTKMFYLRAMEGDYLVWRAPLHMKRKSLGEPGVGQPFFQLYCGYTDYTDEECAGTNGEMWFFQNIGDPVYIYPEQWYQFEIMVDPGPLGVARSGVLKLWINGELKMHHTGVSVRKAFHTIGINSWQASGYYGGGGAEIPFDMDFYIDNIVIGRSYIGPVYSLDIIPPSAPSGLSVS